MSHITLKSFERLNAYYIASDVMIDGSLHRLMFGYAQGDDAVKLVGSRRRELALAESLVEELEGMATQLIPTIQRMDKARAEVEREKRMGDERSPLNMFTALDAALHGEKLSPARELGAESIEHILQNRLSAEEMRRCLALLLWSLPMEALDEVLKLLRDRKPLDPDVKR